MVDHANKPKTIVNHNHAQNSSCRAKGRTQKTVVRVVTIIGCNLVFHAEITEWTESIHFSRFLFILSINIIASFTTTQVRAINHIPNVIEYGFHVIYSQILTQSKAKITEYNTIAGCAKELNWNTKILKIKNIDIKSDFIVDTIKSIFSSFSHQTENDIHSG